MKDTLDTSGTALLLELAHALNRNGWAPTDIKWLTEGERLATILPVARGCGKVQIITHFIDLAADPFIPSGLTLEKHTPGVSQFEWNPAKVRLHLSENQKDGKSIEGNKLRKELATESPFNANLLDYLVDHPDLIPEDWKKDADGNTRYIYFWGTIFRYADDDLCVRCLCWGDDGWCVDYGWLNSRWSSSDPAACLAK
ncbi:MAG: hypothetical protein RJB39_489 [Candidatus Parcubacteria bacterium]|jgi:hypothetical protein